LGSGGGRLARASFDQRLSTPAGLKLRTSSGEGSKKEEQAISRSTSVAIRKSLIIKTYELKYKTI
jgi:hypothetical protein